MFRFVARFARVKIEDSSRNRFALNGIQRDFYRGDFFRGDFIRIPFAPGLAHDASFIATLSVLLNSEDQDLIMAGLEACLTAVQVGKKSPK